MKILSETMQGGRVVELTHDEWVELQLLAQSIEGKTPDETVWAFNIRDRSAYAVGSDIELNGVFGAILAFYEAKFNITLMQRAVDMLKSSIERRSPHA